MSNNYFNYSLYYFVYEVVMYLVFVSIFFLLISFSQKLKIKYKPAQVFSFDGVKTQVFVDANQIF